MTEKKKVLLSGIQPSGQLCIGNYAGALKNWVNLQDEYDSIFLIVDLHALTVKQVPADLRNRCLSFLAQYIACGIDPDKNTVVIQSHVPEHAELAWVLNTITYFGELNRMTQFKDKSKRHSANINTGLFTYPVLMAADILIYKATHVPVGDDQRQHLELAREIVGTFNHRYGQDYFPEPESVIMGEGARIMSLRDGTQKMSKSAESDMTRINLTDDADTIAKKIRKAKTDAEPLPEIIGLRNVREPEGNSSKIFREVNNLDESYGYFNSGITFCDNLTASEVLVGSGLMLYDDISIYATGSVDMCSFGGFITPGFNLGNPIKIKVYRPSEMMEYETENLTFSNGSGTFTELFTEVTSLSLVNEITNSAPTAVIDQLEVETYRNTNITLDGSSSVDSDGNITSYEWYLNGEDLIGSNQSLTHQFSTLGDYMITLVVTDNESAIGSSVSVASVINQLPTEVSLLSPNNAEIVNIDDFENGTINFSWTESIDLDNDNLTYTINLWKTDMPEEHNVEMELMDTSYLTAFNSEFLDLEIDMDQNYSWNITVSDGFDEVSSSTNTFELSFVMDSNTEYNPNQYSLSQNYPNPFNPNTEIQYSLNRAELVTLDIYNIAGKYIVQLINEKQNAGVHSINWNATDQNGISVPAGLYIFKLNSQSNGSIQKTMTLLK